MGNKIYLSRYRDLKTEYDFCIISLWVFGGVISFSCSLCNYLIRLNKSVLLITSSEVYKFYLQNKDIFNEKLDILVFDIIENPSWVKEIKNLIKKLACKKINRLYIMHPLMAPLFLPIIHKFQTYLHFEYWEDPQIEIFIKNYEVYQSHSERNVWKFLFEKLSSKYKNGCVRNVMGEIYWKNALAKSIQYARKIGIWRYSDLKKWEIFKKDKIYFFPPSVDITAICAVNELDYPKISYKVLINAHKHELQNSLRTIRILVKAKKQNDLLSVLIFGASTGIKEKYSEYCTCIQKIKYKDMPIIYAKGDFYCILSRYRDPSPMSLIEAMSFGLVPLVSSFIAESFPKNSRIGKCLIVVKNIQDINKVILFYHRYPKKLIESKMNAINAVESEASFSKIIPIFFDEESY